MLNRLDAIAIALWQSQVHEEDLGLESPLGATDMAAVAIRRNLTALWQTDELRTSRLTVPEEVTNALFYFDLPRGIYFDSKKGVCGRLPTVLLSFVLIALALTGFVATLATTMNFERATVAPGPPASVVSTDASESPTIEL